MGGVTYAPRLRDAIPNCPKPPSVKTAPQRVYKVPPGEQDAVFASVPRPPGPQNVDPSYSPLWLVYMVHWKDPAHARVLTGEQPILDAAERGGLTIKRTDIVINGRIVATASGGSAPGVLIAR